MAGMHWNDWYSGWGWILWFGFLALMFSSAGNWRYTYRVHRNFGRPVGHEALDILSERYARGDISHEEYSRIKAAITA